MGCILHVHLKLMCVCIIFYASHTCIHQEHHHFCIMVYASLGQHHGKCIVSYAPFHLHMEHSILVLHHHCNHPSLGCIIIMAIEHLHSKLEYFATIP